MFTYLPTYRPTYLGKVWNESLSHVASLASTLQHRSISEMTPGDWTGAVACLPACLPACPTRLKCDQLKRENTYLARSRRWRILTCLVLQRAETRWIEARCYSGVEGNSSAVQCSVVLGSYPRGKYSVGIKWRWSGEICDDPVRWSLGSPSGLLPCIN